MKTIPGKTVIMLVLALIPGSVVLSQDPGPVDNPFSDQVSSLTGISTLSEQVMSVRPPKPGEFSPISDSISSWMDQVRFHTIFRSTDKDLVELDTIWDGHRFQQMIGGSETLMTWAGNSPIPGASIPASPLIVRPLWFLQCDASDRSVLLPSRFRDDNWLRERIARLFLHRIQFSGAENEARYSVDGESALRDLGLKSLIVCFSRNQKFGNLELISHCDVTLANGQSQKRKYEYSLEKDNSGSSFIVVRAASVEYVNKSPGMGFDPVEVLSEVEINMDYPSSAFLFHRH